MTYLIYIVNILIGLLTSYLLYKELKKTKNTEIIEDINLLPAEINYIARDLHYINRGILSTLLDLHRKGNISIEKYNRESRNKSVAESVTEYKFTLLSKENLSSIEKEFINLTFLEGDTITTDTLTQNHLEGKEKYFNRWGDWLKFIEEKLVQQNILTRKKSKENNYYKYLALASAVIGIVSI